MSLTRSYLKSMGLSEEQIGAIIERHTETINGLKEERNKAAAEAVETLTQERDKLQADLEKVSGDASKIQAEYDAYKAKIEAEQTNASKRALVKKALEGAGANPAAIDLLAECINLDEIEIENNAIKDVDSALYTVKTDYAALFGKPEQRGTPTITPPEGDGTGAASDVRQIAQKYHETFYS